MLEDFIIRHRNSVLTMIGIGVTVALEWYSLLWIEIPWLMYDVYKDFKD